MCSAASVFDTKQNDLPCTSNSNSSTYIMFLLLLLFAIATDLTINATPPTTCTNGKVWNECGSACTATCDQPFPICTMQCVPGCECPSKAPVLHPDGFCVQSSECPKHINCQGGRVYNDCALKCIKTCAQPNPPCVKMCAPRCACPPEIPVWQNGQCIQQEQCPVTQKKKIMALKALKQQDKKIPSLWESFTSLFVATNVDCTTGPGGKRCENGGVEHGTLGNCKCECPRLTAGDNCEIVIAIGRPYSHLRSTIQTTLKTCANTQDMTCTGGWNMEDAMPLNVFDGSEIFDRHALQQAIDEYTLQGIAEHTSIASFSRVTLQLLSIGAPASIVGLSLSATQDEVRHAKLCFAIADQLSGRLVASQTTATHSKYPDVFPFPNASVHVPNSLYAMAAETLEEGILGESVAAVKLCVRSQTTSNLKLRLILRGIGQDEAKHAALAWKTIGFAVHEHAHQDDAKRAVQVWLNNDSKRRKNIAEVKVDEEDKDLRSDHFGLLNSNQVKWIQQEMVEHTIRPLLRQLLNASSWQDFQSHVLNIKQRKGVMGECVGQAMDEFLKI